MKTRENGLTGSTGKNKTGKRAPKGPSTPPASLGRPAGQTAPEAPAPRPAQTKAPAPQPVQTKAPAPLPAQAKAPAPQPVQAKAPTPQPVQAKAPAPQPVQAKAPTPQPVQAKAPAAPQTVNVVFWIFQPQARRVSVCGEFNGWSPEANPMEPRGEGRWQAVVALRPGRYQYKFVIDGEWMPDPDAKQNVCNAFGTLNSVVEAA